MSFDFCLVLLAGLAEVVATFSLKACHGFTRPWPTAGVVVGYGASFFLLGLSLRSVPIGLAYAVWSGTGIVLLAAIGRAVYHEKLDFAGVAGVSLILVGVAVLGVWSRTPVH